MTDNELYLLNLVRNNTHPVKAMEIALATICLYLTRSQSFATPSAADYQALA